MAYTPDYAAEDLSAVSIDGVVIAIVTIASFAALIVIAFLFGMVRKRLKM